MKRNTAFLYVLLYTLLTLIFANGAICVLFGDHVTNAMHVQAFGVVQIGLSALALMVTVVYQANRQRRMRRTLLAIDEKLHAASPVTTRLGLPVLQTKNDRVEWYNDAFLEQVLQNKACKGKQIADLFGTPLEETDLLQYNQHIYQVHTVESEEDSIHYFIDVTELNTLQDEYDATRPVLAYITVDNLEELTAGSKDSERADMSMMVERTIEQWANRFHCLLKKTAADRFVAITDERGLAYMKETKFDLLKSVRSLDFGEKGSATLSVGIGHNGSNFDENEQFARDALEMALGRGGDQVAVKNGNDFDFYGGTSSTTSKRSKVRTRMAASSLAKLIQDSERVLIMGHRNADLDCIGSAFGLSHVIRQLDKPVNMVVNRETCLCNNLIDHVCRDDHELIISPDEAQDYIDEDTLLILTDTHRRAFLESPEVYDACQTVAIIDHHRKTVDFIDDSVIFYHEPYSSSASEMVTELTQYMGTKLSKLEAEALLAGIMLDTRNFVLHTSSRTFDAAAYLRSCGANPVTVKGFFQNSVDVFKEKGVLVSSAAIYERCAISYSRHTGPGVMVAASQAADEMLGIENVDASFVFFNMGDCINVSARSLGAVNVQLLMEKLGGGGHLTMAAAQLYGVTLEQTMKQLVDAIDQYYNENA